MNNYRTIQVYQQVDRDHPRIVKYLKTDAGFREVDLCTMVGEYLHAFVNRKHGLLFETRNGTPYLHNSLEHAGLRLVSKRWESMKKEWVFTPFAVFARLG